MSASDRTLAFRVEGRVQGVGYRAFAQHEAARLGVKGWVVNRDDGSVEGVLQGAGAALADLVGRLRQGPAGAHVEALDVHSTEQDRLSDVPAAGHGF